MKIKAAQLFRFLGIVVAILCLVAVAALFYVTDCMLPYSPIRPHRLSAEFVRARFLNGGADPSAVGFRWEECSITVEDTLRLRGWFLHAGQPRTKGTIFLLHGIGSCKEAQLTMATMLAADGYNCVVYDSRAHGRSGGTDCTFGYYENGDCMRMLDSVIARFPDSGPYALYGHSMGAAITVQTLAEDPRFVCGIAESPFADLRTTVREYGIRMYNIRFDWMFDRALRKSEQIARFAVDSVSPRASAARIDRPVMIIHGLADNNITAVHGKEVYDALASTQREWFPVPGAGHNNVRRTAGSDYDKRVLEFFHKHMRADRAKKKQEKPRCQ